MNKKSGLFKAGTWTGADWLITLCVMHALVSIFYVVIHIQVPGHEYIQLETDQVKTMNNLLSMYPDTQSPTSLLKEYTLQFPKDTAKRRLYDSVSRLRIQRTVTVVQFLRAAYKEDLDAVQMKELDSTMKELNTKDAVTYITEKKFLVSSFFWLKGPLPYLEALLWSFIGAITSLIYYVSLANQLTLKKAEGDDIGPFDTSEIPAQVAKMFYAPIITLVFVLGYNYFSGKNSSAINISVNHGLIVFSFIAGSYSGRLMKLLDGLKNLILPLSSDGNTKKAGNGITAPVAGTTDITVQPGLGDAAAKSPDGAGIVEAGFNAAIVTLEPADKKGESIHLNKPADDQSGMFTGAKIPYGKYTLQAKYAYNNKQTILNLSASQDIEVSEKSKSFTLALDIVKEQG